MVNRFTRKTALTLCVLLSVCALFLSREVARLPDGRTHVHFLDVGQGDSILILSPSGKTILVDGGPDLSTLEHLGRLLAFSQKTIDLLILTHPDRDHLSAFPELLRRYSVRAILLTRAASEEWEEFPDFLALIEERQVPIILANPSRDIDMGDGLFFDVLWPPATPSLSGANETSIVLRAITGSGAVLLTGDIPAKEEATLLSLGSNVRATYLQLPHHGSDTSSSVNFLAAVRPRAAIISVGRNNPYGHPHPTILERLSSLGIPVRSTAMEGTISLVLDPGPGELVEVPSAEKAAGRTMIP
jgi:competence protein ComEC